MSSGADRITREDAADRLGVSLRTLDRYGGPHGPLTRERNPVTGRVTYDPDQVEHLRRVRLGEGVS